MTNDGGAAPAAGGGGWMSEPERLTGYAVEAWRTADGRVVSPGTEHFLFCAACLVGDAIVVEVRPVRVGLWWCPRCERAISDGAAGAGPETGGWWGVAVGHAPADLVPRQAIVRPIPRDWLTTCGRTRVGGPEGER